MIHVELNGVAIKLPEKWNEIAKEKIPILVELLFMRAENGETYHNILRIVLGYSGKKWVNMMLKYFGRENTEEQKEQSSLALQELLRLISWMWKTALTNKPCEMFLHKGKEYYLPSENLLTMSWGEMKDAYIHAEAFTRQLVKGDKHLNLLILTLCRPKSEAEKGFDWDGDERIPYNEYLVAAQEESIRDLDYAIKLAILLFFVGTMKKILDQYDIFYAGDDSLIPHEEEFPGQGFEDNTLVLAEKQIFGSYKETIKTNCHQVFIALERNKKLIVAEMEAQKSQNS